MHLTEKGKSPVWPDDAPAAEPSSPRDIVTHSSSAVPQSITHVEGSGEDEFGGEACGRPQTLPKPCLFTHSFFRSLIDSVGRFLGLPCKVREGVVP